MEVFTAYYHKLIHLNFKALCPNMVAARIISHEDNFVVQQAVEPTRSASCVLEKISASLQGGIDAKFDKFLFVLANHNDLFCTTLAEQIKRDLLKSTIGKSQGMYGSYVCMNANLLALTYIVITSLTLEQPSYLNGKEYVPFMHGYFLIENMFHIIAVASTTTATAAVLPMHQDCQNCSEKFTGYIIINSILIIDWCNSKM